MRAIGEFKFWFRQSLNFLLEMCCSCGFAASVGQTRPSLLVRAVFTETTPTLSPRHLRRHTGTLEQRNALMQELHDFFIRPPS